MGKLHIEELYLNKTCTRAVFQSDICHSSKIFAFTHFCSIFPHLGEALVTVFCVILGFSVDLSHCLSMGKVTVGYIGLYLLLHLMTAKLFKNCQNT